MIIRIQSQIFKQLHPFHAGSNFSECLICGPSGSGKTNVLLDMIFRLLFYDKIYLYAKNLDQTKYQHLLKTFRPISKEAGYDVVEASSDEIIPVSELTGENQKLVVFDDFVSEKNQKPLIDYFIQGRHKKLLCDLSFAKLFRNTKRYPPELLAFLHFLNFPAAKKSLRSAGKTMVSKEDYQKGNGSALFFPVCG